MNELAGLRGGAAHPVLQSIAPEGAQQRSCPTGAAACLTAAARESHLPVSVSTCCLEPLLNETALFAIFA